MQDKVACNESTMVRSFPRLAHSGILVHWTVLFNKYILILFHFIIEDTISFFSLSLIFWPISIFESSLALNFLFLPLMTWSYNHKNAVTCLRPLIQKWCFCLLVCAKIIFFFFVKIVFSQTPLCKMKWSTYLLILLASNLHSSLKLGMVEGLAFESPNIRHLK